MANGKMDGHIRELANPAMQYRQPRSHRESRPPGSKKITPRIAQYFNAVDERIFRNANDPDNVSDQHAG